MRLELFPSIFSKKLQKSALFSSNYLELIVLKKSKSENFHRKDWAGTYGHPVQLNAASVEVTALK